MKKLFILLACAATMVACSKDEALEANKGEAIAFGNPFVSKVTKADVETYGAGKNLTAFNVWGTVTGQGGAELIYDGVEFTGTVGGGEWTCSSNNKQYWVKDANYVFTAIADYTSVTPASGSMPTKIGYTRSSSPQGDLILAQTTAVGKASGNTAVPLTFSHLLSKVKFTVTSDAVNGYSHKVTNITVANFSEGTFTLGATPAAGTWGSTTDEVVNFAAIEGVESTDATGVANDAILLIPNEAAFNVSFDVELYKGTTKLSTKSCPTNSVTTKLEAGKSYNFIIDIKTGEEIKFSVASNPTWTPADGSFTVNP